jgi:hypothetical protein
VVKAMPEVADLLTDLLIEMVEVVAVLELLV